ncbi:hypothetical protein TD95_001776, partial [Thielaviopsis punctulata]
AWSVDGILTAFRYIYPSIIYVYFIGSTVFSLLFLHSLRLSIAASPDSFRSPLLLRAMRLCPLTYLVQLGAIVFRSWFVGRWTGKDDEVVSIASCMILYSIQSTRMSDDTFPVWYPYLGSWITGLLFEPILVALWLSSSAPPQLDSNFDTLSLSLYAFRVCFYLATVCCFVVRSYKCPKPLFDEEQQPLLAHSANSKNGVLSQNSSYGSTSQIASAGSSVAALPQDECSDSESDHDEIPGENAEDRKERRQKAFLQKKLLQEGNWFYYLRRYMVLAPYVWPVSNFKLQFYAFLVVLCMAIGNVINLLLPRQIGIIMDSLTGQIDSRIWGQLAAFAALKLLASDSGIPFLQEWLYFPIANYSREALNLAAFKHVLCLSAKFHDSKSTSDTTTAIRGGEKCSSLIETVVFEGLSRVFDLFVAIIYLTLTFGPYEGLISITTGTMYLFLSAKLITSTRGARRHYVTAYYAESGALYNGIDGWQTVAAFNQARHEHTRYAGAVSALIQHMKEYTFHWFGTRACQSLALLAGLFSGCVLAVVRIQRGEATPGQFAMLLMYWSQLSGPLMQLTYISKSVSSMMMDTERILELLNTKSSVPNQPNARPLRLIHGDVEFNGVTFAYNKKKNVIQEVSFFVHGGQSVAFVGATGSGKSTILKLLSRFYDPSSGSILIDNQDIKEVDLYSLREHIGLVPQSPVLFNDTVINNIRYARMSATDEEVFDACRAACIHDKILTFTNGYETKVGERGVKLSGGELQRVAIARAILKRPDIVLLDEATSAIDTETEQKIQESFRNLTKNRTTFIVAHRLSTIMNADRIVVVSDGKIQEMGDHESLLKSKGKYYDLWTKQTFVKAKSSEGHGSDDQIEVVNDVFGKPESAHDEGPAKDDGKIYDATQEPEIDAGPKAAVDGVPTQSDTPGDDGQTALSQQGQSSPSP